MRASRRSCAGLLAGILACAGAGCRSPDKPVAVRGTVTLDGQPVAGAAVQFVPDGEGLPAIGETQADGTYALTTHEPGDGAVPGKYMVVIVWEPPPPPTFRTGGDGPSRLEMQQALEKHRAAVEKAGKGYTIPAQYSNPSQTPLKVTVPAPGGRADFALSSKS